MQAYKQKKDNPPLEMTICGDLRDELALLAFKMERIVLNQLPFFCTRAAELFYLMAD